MNLFSFKNISLLVAMLLGAVTFYSCGEGSEDDQVNVQEELDESILQAYFAANNLTPEKTSSGLYYIIEELGAGGSPSSADSASIYYVGSFLNGHIFDSTLDQIEPIDLHVGSSIAGFSEGLQLIQKNGKIKLILPSRLAYGTTGTSSISPNSILLYDVELVDFF